MPRASGQALVEMALVLPVVILIFLVILEIGLAYNTRQAVTHAAREGARSAVVLNPAVTQNDVRTTITNALGRSGVAGGAVTITFDEATPPGGHWRETGAMQTVYVAVQHRFDFI